MDTSPRSWALNRPVTSPFAVPAGLFGRLAGRVMLWTNKQEDVLDLLRVGPGERVLEVGYGPGALVRILAERTQAASIEGVDPSSVMRDAAVKLNRTGVRAGRVRLRLGSAERTGCADESVDRVVSVNSVAIWPDLEAGLDELRRVLRPGGTALIAWHGGSEPSRIARSLRLPDDKLNRIERGLAARFASVTRHTLKGLDAFQATR